MQNDPQAIPHPRFRVQGWWDFYGVRGISAVKDLSCAKNLCSRLRAVITGEEESRGLMSQGLMSSSGTRSATLLVPP